MKCTAVVPGTVAAVCLVLLLSACGGADEPGFFNRLLDREPLPDSLPVMLNTEPPFRYPTALYAERAEGSVSLRLFIDIEGNVVADSTAIVQSSGHAAFDSVALSGSRDLKFSAATRRGKPMPVRIVYPVFFRHPEGAAGKAAQKGDTT